MAANPGEWCRTDALLAQALEEYERTRVGSYGFPRRLTEGDHEGEFEVRMQQDNAILALDVWERDNRGRDTQPGMRPRVIYAGPSTQ